MLFNLQDILCMYNYILGNDTFFQMPYNILWGREFLWSTFKFEHMKDRIAALCILFTVCSDT